MNRATMAVLFALAATAAACDTTTAPRNAASVPDVSVYGGGATEAVTAMDTIRFSITIDPSRNTYYYLGAGNSLNFPAHSLCDPTKSTYGVGEWERPCVSAHSPVTVQVKAWLDALGHARVDFDQHLRFVPSANPAAWVLLTFRDLQASLDPFFNILYCPTTNSACIDESRTDPSLLTLRDPLTGKVTRRIKHFSGYNVAAGASAFGSDYNVINSNGSGLSVSTTDLQLDDVQAIARAHPGFSRGNLTEMLTGIRAARRFSGYILASGDQEN